MKRFSLQFFLLLNHATSSWERNYLIHISNVLDKNLEIILGSSDARTVSAVRLSLDAIIESFLEQQEKSRREINSLSQRLDAAINQPIAQFGEIQLARDLLHVPGVYLMDYVNVLDAHSHTGRIFRMAQRVGLSSVETHQACVKILDPSDLDALNERILDFVAHAPLRTAVPEDIQALIGSFDSQRRLKDMYALVQSVDLKRRVIGGMGILYFASHICNLSDPHIQQAVSVIMQALEKVSFFPDILFEAQILDITAMSETISEFTEAVRANSSQNLDSVGRLGPLLLRFGALGFPLSDWKEDMRRKIDSVISEARIALAPRLYSLVDRVFVVRENQSRLVLVEAVIDSSVSIITGVVPDQSLVSLASWLDSNSGFLKVLGSLDDTLYEDTVLNVSFDFARLFGIKLLRQFPALLPSRTPGEIVALRKIIGVFLQFDGPHEWKNTRELRPKILIAQEKTLNRAVSILTVLFQIRCESVEKIPLIRSGDWLAGFLSTPPSEEALWVHDLLLPRILPTAIRKKLFTGFEEEVENLFKFPAKFLNLRDRIHFIASKYRGSLPESRFRYFATLPGFLITVEVRAQRLNPSISQRLLKLVEKAVVAFYDAVEVVARKHSLTQFDPQNNHVLLSYFTIVRTIAFGVSRRIPDSVFPKAIESFEKFFTECEEFCRHIENDEPISEPDHISSYIF